ncbi:MAG TPA: Obg family GTPase CgtA [Verrucomicrobiae bacterium]|nr:Obg family GTPase CgtA [Verrucomicrobiae bacterium]
MFVDKVKIRVKAGDGGNGSVSFRREKYVDRGGPDGGDGGKGGDVVLVADKNATDLSDLYYQPRVVAKHGVHGRGKNCFGRSAKNVVVKVPIGTQVFRLTAPVKQRAPSNYHPAAATEEFDPTAGVGMPFTPGRAKQLAREMEEDHLIEPQRHRGHREESGERGGGGGQEGMAMDGVGAVVRPAPNDGVGPERELIADLVEDGQQFVLAKGGRGGRGNAAFKSSTHQAPREFEFGEAGEQLDVELELKTLADVGLVGFPNAGKSTLIAKITNAHPKVAPYPFTTLTPNVGILNYDDFTRIRIADIPGLIEGAHRGKGLGHDFLRHIERCQLLVVLLDMAGVDGRKPQDDYEQLIEELKLYNPEILKKKRLVVANKMDLPEAKKNLTAFKRKMTGGARKKQSPAFAKATAGRPAQVKILEISALEGAGLEKFKLELHKALA